MIHVSINILSFYDSSQCNVLVNVFCGSLNCYDILEVAQDATLKDIKKVIGFVHFISFVIGFCRPIEDSL
jgi:hypothetical protein